MHPPTALILLIALLAPWATPDASALTFTCSTVIAKRLADPDGDALKDHFREPAINVHGDVVFYGKSTVRRLYLYPNMGAASIVASQGDGAPGGGIFTKFRSPSVNDAGDIGFFGDLALGEGVFVRPSGGGIVKAALAGETAPAGGTFFQFPSTSHVNASGDIAFTATVDGGPHGVFFFDQSATTVSSVARVGDATGDGREFCDFLTNSAYTLGLGDSGNAVFQATTSTDCANAPAISGIWMQSGGGFTNVADVGDATPAGGTYSLFLQAPFANAADRILFRAELGSGFSASGLFLFDPTGSTVSKLAAAGDPAPGTGPGLLSTIAPPGGLTNGNRALFRSSVKKGDAGNGVFLFDSPEAVAVVKGATPTDVFPSGSTYRRIMEQTGVDRSGTWVAFSANVRVHSPLKEGLFRCAGS